jgi:hypothetical protein
LRIVQYVPLMSVFILALLLGFSVRMILPQSADLGPQGGTDAHVGAPVHRRRLIAMTSPFRVNPLAGQIPKPRRGSAEHESILDTTYHKGTDSSAQHAIGAPAARDSDLGGDIKPKSKTEEQPDPEAMPGEVAPIVELTGLGRRLSPGPTAALAPAGVAAPAVSVMEQQSVRGPDGELLPLAQPLRVCLLAGDFYGLPNPGPIATAYTLLAAALGTDPSLKVHITLIRTPAALLAPSVHLLL